MHSKKFQGNLKNFRLNVVFENFLKIRSIFFQRVEFGSTLPFCVSNEAKMSLCG